MIQKISLYLFITFILVYKIMFLENKMAALQHII